jgi:hypothetical protein
MFPTISGQVSEIKVMPGDYVKQGRAAVIGEFGHGRLQQ